jgi:hypothetical protein
MNEHNTEYTNISVNNKRESFRNLKNSNILNQNKSNHSFCENINEECVDDDSIINNSSISKTQAVNSNTYMVKTKRRSLPQVNQFSIHSNNDSNFKICACCSYSFNNLNENSFGKCEICLAEICDKCHIITKLENKICILCKICSKMDNDALMTKKKNEDNDNRLLSSTNEKNSLVNKYDIVPNKIKKNVSIVINFFIEIIYINEKLKF